MKALNLAGLNHKTFIFLRPTEMRLNGSVAWLAVCKTCGHEQLVGSSQIKRGTHAACIQCRALRESETRELRQ